MNLEQYLFYKKLSVQEFALKSDLSRSYLSSIISGRVNPSKKTCRTIERATDGEVKAENVFQPTKIPDEYK